MAPSLSQSDSSQSKKQQTISSFFTPKSVPATKSRASTEILNSAATNNSNPASRTNTSKTKPTQEDSGDDSDNEPRSTFRRSLKRHREDEAPAEKQAKRRTSKSDDDEYVDDEVHQDQDDKAPTPRTIVSNSRALGQTDANGSRASRTTDRTSKYLFSSSPLEDENTQMDEGEEEIEKKRKEKLHRQFVKRLGRPDSIAEIKRRNHVLEDHAAGGEGADEEEEDAEDEKPSKGKKGAAKKGPGKLTPMERQIVELKRKHMDAVLLFEVGYKFRFFGEDARTAAKVLSIVCIPGKMRYDEHPSEAHLDRFASASFPVQRLHVHVKRLVQAGYKVGVVRQVETAALKAAGDNRNAPFVRKLTDMYTKGTYIDDTAALEGSTAGSSGVTATGHLLCLTESNLKGGSSDEKVHVGIVAVQPTTGDIIYDDFEDGFMRGEIESRLLHIAPCEFVIVGELSNATNKLIQHLSSSKSNVFSDQARVERVPKSKTMASETYSHVSKFYADKMKEGAESSQCTHLLDKVHELSEHVTICLSALIKHLSEYGLEHVFDLTKNFQPFSARSHMFLNGNTLTSLEIYQNQTDHTPKGSLFWCLDRTRTRFGQRLLRKWVGRPLLDKAKLEQRIEAVAELKDRQQSMPVDKVKHVLGKTKSDLEKSLIRIYYKKCSRSELLSVLQTLQMVGTEYGDVKSPSASGFKSSVIGDAIAILPKVGEPVIAHLEKINSQAARENDKYAFFRDEHETDKITEHKVGIAAVEADLDEHKAEAAEKLRKSKINYTKCAGIEYLIEVDNSQLKNVPASWAKISGTKKVSRFHTPKVIKLLRERDQHKEALAAACDDAFTALLGEIAGQYEIFRDCIQALATLDCLLSLADVAQQPGYVSPVFEDEPGIHIEQGRHPMVEQILLDSYVPNDTALDGYSPSRVGNDPRALLITGPNMGGKSSYVRQIALIAIMAQIGSHVPASSARLGLLDAVFTRMGAFDNMMRGESTFMVELAETSDLLRQASPRSLVLLDELGRGTSTHDGVAIAEAVLKHVVNDVRCLTLFITHYQALSRLAGWSADRKAKEGDGLRELRNVHVRFTEEGEDITFLYEVGEGVAHRSYGLNVARLANVPESVLDLASVKSREMELGMRRKKLGYLCRGLGRFLEGVPEADVEEVDTLIGAIEQL